MTAAPRGPDPVAEDIIKPDVTAPGINILAGARSFLEIAEGFDDELDELRGIADNADRFLLDLEAREKERTGIATLKLGYNRVHGYYIEISKLHAESVPEEYVRRQTLKNNERYITPELKKFEDQVLSARERALAREKQLYEELLERLATEIAGLKATAEGVATLDLFCNHAERAQALRLNRPALVEEAGIRITAGRHPVVEQVSDSPFVPNDTLLDESTRMLIITGPNMAGKSTVMRQVALTVLMAQTGCFVPARRVTKVDPVTALTPS